MTPWRRPCAGSPILAVLASSILRLSNAGALARPLKLTSIQARCNFKAAAQVNQGLNLGRALRGLSLDFLQGVTLGFSHTKRITRAVT